MFATLKHNGWALVILLAIVASFVVSDRESAHRNNVQQATIIANCLSTSARTAISANGWHQLALRVARRGNPGDATSAETYQATAESLIDQIPAPHGFRGDPGLAEVRRALDSKARVKFVLTQFALDLQKRGCEDA